MRPQYTYLEAADAPDEDGDMHSDGDIIGDVKGSARWRKLSSVTAHPGSIPFECQWEPDVDVSVQASSSHSVRQLKNIQTGQRHLIVQSEPVIASSDGPALTTFDVSRTGNTQVQIFTLHALYSRFHTLQQGRIASGSFDRTVKLWDRPRALQPSTANPISTLTPPESSAPRYRYMHLPSTHKGTCSSLAVWSMRALTTTTPTPSSNG
ncbi:hypothetical protein BC826DRAFT_1112652 [Russula brevipes]|nr:hypothetical protein BC826DRAFT_1112652 [Russula brevipes]